ncbi:MAG: hypothetical protein BWZ10_01488 [candidate division BRC1 bacterium ADurb.BinA364]|nr:MAG: hypothetical protein BWZ10_01488 [candidate division BRC1 bacterium ADurb.BinA364]
MRDGKPQAGAFAGGFGGVERQKRALARRFIQAGARILDAEQKVFAFRQFHLGRRIARADGRSAQRHAQRSSAGSHGLIRVGAQVHHDLMNLRRIGQRAAGVLVDSRLEPDRGRNARPQKLQALLDQRGDFDRLALLLGLSAESQDLFDQFPRPLARLANFAQIALLPASRRRIFAQHVGVAQHGRKDIVEIVRDSPGQRADGFHALGLPQPAFHRRLAGDVSLQPHIAEQAAARIAYRRDDRLFFHQRTVFFAVDDPAFPDPAVGDFVPQFYVKGVVVPPRFENAGILADGFGGAVARRRLEGRIDIADRASRIGDDDMLGRLIDRRRQNTQIGFGPARLGNIAEAPNAPRDLAPDPLRLAGLLQDAPILQFQQVVDFALRTAKRLARFRPERLWIFQSFRDGSKRPQLSAGLHFLVRQPPNLLESIVMQGAGAAKIGDEQAVGRGFHRGAQQRNHLAQRRFGASAGCHVMQQNQKRVLAFPGRVEDTHFHDSRQAAGQGHDDFRSVSGNEWMRERLANQRIGRTGQQPTGGGVGVAPATLAIDHDRPGIHLFDDGMKTGAAGPQRVARQAQRRDVRRDAAHAGRLAVAFQAGRIDEHIDTRAAFAPQTIFARLCRLAPDQRNECIPSSCQIAGSDQIEHAQSPSDVLARVAAPLVSRPVGIGDASRQVRFEQRLRQKLRQFAKSPLAFAVRVLRSFLQNQTADLRSRRLQRIPGVLRNAFVAMRQKIEAGDGAAFVQNGNDGHGAEMQLPLQIVEQRRQVRRLPIDRLALGDDPRMRRVGVVMPSGFRESLRQSFVASQIDFAALGVDKINAAAVQAFDFQQRLKRSSQRMRQVPGAAQRESDIALRSQRGQRAGALGVRPLQFGDPQPQSFGFARAGRVFPEIVQSQGPSLHSIGRIAAAGWQSRGACKGRIRARPVLCRTSSALTSFESNTNS